MGINYLSVRAAQVAARAHPFAKPFQFKWCRWSPMRERYPLMRSLCAMKSQRPRLLPISRRAEEREFPEQQQVQRILSVQIKREGESFRNKLGPQSRNCSVMLSIIDVMEGEYTYVNAAVCTRPVNDVNARPSRLHTTQVETEQRNGSSHQLSRRFFPLSVRFSRARNNVPSYFRLLHQTRHWPAVSNFLTAHPVQKPTQSQQKYPRTLFQEMHLVAGVWERTIWGKTDSTAIFWKNVALTHIAFIHIQPTYLSIY